MAKMLVYIGKGTPRETYEFNLRKLMYAELDAMERVTGLIGSDLEDALNKGGAGATRAWVWVMRKRIRPSLRYEQVDFESESLEWEVVNDDGTPLAEPEDDKDDIQDVVKPEPVPEAPKARRVRSAAN